MKGGSNGKRRVCCPERKGEYCLSAGHRDAKEEVELPLRILVMGDFTQSPDDRMLEEREPINIDKDNFNEVLKEQHIGLNLTVPNKISGEPDDELSVNLNFESIKDFEPEAIARKTPELKKLLELREALTALKGPLSNVPAFRKNCRSWSRMRRPGTIVERTRRSRRITKEDRMPEEQEQSVSAAEQTTEAQPSLLEDIVQATKLKPSDESYGLAKKGVEALIAQLIEPGKKVDKVSKADVDEMIAEIDNKLSLQLDAILHNRQFQKLESGWRSLKYLVDKTDFRENIKVEILNVSKGDLLEDFEDAPEIPSPVSIKPCIRRNTASLAASPMGP